MSKRVVLTVSGVIPADIREQIASGKRPRADYLELAQSFDADLLDYAAARTITGRTGAVLERFGGPNLLLAFACWKVRKRYQAIVTDGEQVGLPLATFLRLTPGRRPRHLMIVHVISEPKKMVFLDWLGVQSTIDRFITYSRWQQRFIEDRWKLSRDRVPWTPFMVDQEFFAPQRVAPSSGTRPQICAVGLERRDYETLLQAVEGLDVRVVIAAASPWSKRTEGVATRSVPNNVTVRKYSQYELRQLYLDSCFMVMPLENVNFQAGVTAILECLAMGKAVICSRVLGQTDVVVEGENGLYVPPADPSTLRTEIRRLLSCPEEADRLGANGRKLIECQMNLDLYVKRMTGFLGGAIGGEGP
ncbi:glycosyltransferase family 4 protein [Bradyrhizobium erythrophlei]|uniref:Glycosyltransferase involved in cell wall bisynthesis n=1 Tax=Bradyrhizobium erythrophlei TaxID=1437360 RepID=A0A1M7SQC0_9BRAD|nr:glycosyltransferase family 4 protein [Bradyrhizobium erythrophlei]SHN60629.1 Glycosyltransferase involved in cell wall bisynthesis [Bradyrhizobium erythrophlei]